MRSAVGLKRPDLHFSETLSAKLGFSTKRLLRNQRIWADRAGMDLVVHKMRQLQHIDVAHANLLLEQFAGQTVIETRLARRAYRRRQTELVVAIIGLADVCLDLVFARTVKNRRRKVKAQHTGRPTEMCFEYLPDVHTRRHAKRIE